MRRTATCCTSSFRRWPTGATDAYGGSLDKRMRYPLEVIDAVRATVAGRCELGVRVSATDWVDGGWDIEECMVFAAALRERGLGFIHVSSGGVSPLQKIALGPGYQVHLAERIKRETGLPTIAVGLITEPKQAEGHHRRRASRTWSPWRAASSTIRAGPGMRPPNSAPR
jgi:2,4-dienoyl-CoA reductase-like NADH-dependent reductase (Old Yellow Enzyme family)